ncbi:alpha/beta fold hydrolase [Dictyobacter arantiisoli]|uniref:Lysophospholipase n=1 Tax=Dictyobacter arantiisoli TaxID=2014874 RepID=A0A5A5TJF1_9CHLR|nr:alpha/beta fold hydrolase [Dictyobacter arantiisoli]GCF11472.1 lysophospholipase [Dictyobacter arantiisoli]
MVRYQPEVPGVWGQSSEEQAGAFRSEYVTLPDQCQLFVRSWVRPGVDVLLILHGLGGHGGWYVDMANEVWERGLSVYTVDHRGFGQSQGLKGHIDAYQQYVEDSAEIIREIRQRHPGQKIYCMGHSMGGIFASYIAAQHGDLLAGVIFLNPWIKDTAQISLRTASGILLGGIFKSRRLWQVGGGHEGMTANPEAGRMLDADPYWVRAQTASFLLQILRMRLGAIKQAARISIPALVIQAEGDTVVDREATYGLYHALGSQDKTWKSYPTWFHDTQFEAERTPLDNDLVAWIQSHA